MAYKEFTLSNVEQKLGITISRTTLFNHIEPIPASAWLEETLAKGKPLAFVSEKSRSEFIVAPVLVALRELTTNRISIYSGERMDVDEARGLNGECDFILTLTPQLPILKSPIVTMVEAKKNYVEEGLGQCIAQVVGAQLLNQNEGGPGDAVYGCVTTGEVWQFMRLDGKALGLDMDRYYIDNPGKILGIMKTIVDRFRV